MKQLNWYQIFGNTHIIPDGKTVTPTDDIQTLLHCANIWDKDYTTLAEVLADDDTLFLICISDNAIDYLVRSTTWAGGVSAVPVMTSNTTPSGTCFCTSPHSSLAPYKAFDNDKSTEAVTSASEVAASNPSYIGYRFESPTTICGMYVYETSYTYTNCRIQSSSDGITYTNISDSFTLNKGGQTVACTPTTDTYFRFYIGSVGEGVNTRRPILDLKFLPPSITTSESAMQYIGASDYASETLLSDATWNTAIQSSAYFEYVDTAKVPTMTSNTAPSGKVTVSAVRDSYAGYRAFDGNVSTQWDEQSNTTKWIDYEFVEAQTVKKIAWRFYNYAPAYLQSPAIELKGSNDGVTWTSIKTFEKNEFSAADFSSAVSNDNSYTHYRTYIYAQQPTNIFGFFTLQYYGRQVGGVQSWLKAGGITNKKYTTVSEVLSDLTTLATLMASTDAIDYLVTAKGWATEICSDSNAMADIGMNNYAANTLLADETWCKAIGSSAYFTSVLNVSVPVMTSDAQPYGTVTYSSQVSPYYGFYAFDQANRQGWCDTGYRYSVGSWIAYEFPSAVKIYKAHILIRYDTSSNTMKGKIQAGNDNVDMGSFTEVSSSDNDGADVFINNPLLEKKWRLISTQAMANTNSNGMKIQFYGRKDI